MDHRRSGCMASPNTKALDHAWLEINGILDPWVQDHQDLHADPTLLSYRPRTALAKQGDNALGSIHLSVHFICLHSHS